MLAINIKTSFNIEENIDFLFLNFISNLLSVN
jgi:hypothetical protein